MLAYRGIPVIVALIPDVAIPREPVIAVNGIVVSASFAVSVLTGILFGMAPALQSAKTDVREAIDETGGSVAGGRGMGKLRSTLVVAQVALTMVLLAGAGMAVRGLVSMIDTPLGYDPKRVVGAHGGDAAGTIYDLEREERLLPRDPRTLARDARRRKRRHHS